MVNNIPPNPPGNPGNSSPSPADPDPLSSQPYKAQYYIDLKLWKKYWETLFHGADLSDKQVQQMTDNFVKFVWDQMNKVLQDALKKQKERDQEEKEQRG